MKRARRSTPQADPWPGFVEPCLATLHAKPPQGERWLNEIKHDGYRVQMQVREGAAVAFTRRGYDWTNRFRSIADAMLNLPVRQAILDGEVTVPGTSGVSDFGALQDDLGAGRSDRMVYIAFDLLYVDGADLRKRPLVERKERLAELLGSAGTRMLFSEHMDGNGGAMYARACEMGIEGIVAKLKDSPYRSGRGHDWIKVKCAHRDTFRIVGFIAAPNSVAALYLGREEGGELVYAGKAGTGFTVASARELRKRLDPLVTRTQPLTRRISKPKATWVQPELLADVEYRGLTDEGLLRHASFKGVREDLGN